MAIKRATYKIREGRRDDGTIRYYLSKKGWILWNDWFPGFDSLEAVIKHIKALHMKLEIIHVVFDETPTIRTIDLTKESKDERS